MGIVSSKSSTASDVEMADLMRSNGMIYVVVAVLSIIFVGILIFLLLIERRLKKLEKEEEPN
ncbi:MAG: CcmD family protein [Bacteroidetes bacterium]|nr:MAG: CcmD family protein [Bacteroidota bacterium]